MDLMFIRSSLQAGRLSGMVLNKDRSNLESSRANRPEEPEKGTYFLSRVHWWAVSL
jgi:hypothetical protein